MQGSYPQIAQHPPASSTSNSFTFCLRRVTASPTHRLHRHRRAPSLPWEYPPNSVKPWCRQTRTSTGHLRLGSGGLPALATKGTGGGARRDGIEHMFPWGADETMPPAGFEPASFGLKGRRVIHYATGAFT